MRSLLVLALLGVLTVGLASRADAYVYWANRGGEGSGTTLGRASLAGGGVTQTFIGNAAGPCGVAVDDAHIYWANLGGPSIGRANIDGTGVNQKFIQTASFPCGVAVDNAHVYWASFDGTIGRANLNGTGADQDFISGATNPCGVAVNATHIYWGNQQANAIGRASLNGSGVDQTFIPADGPCGVALNTTRLYWANTGLGGGTRIGRANLNGTDVNQSFIAGAAAPCGIAVDDAHVYWSNNGIVDSGSIGRANLNGTAANQKFIAAGPDLPCGIAVDALPPSNEFSFGKARKNRRKGTAKLPVNVPGPGDIQLASTMKVKPELRRAAAEGELVLPVRTKHRAKKRLRKRGKLNVRAKVTFAPDDGEPNTEINALKLKRR